DQHRALADADELAHGDAAAEDDIVADGDVTAEHGVVGEDDLVADHAVVTDMRADHDEAAIADFGDAAAVLRARVHGDVFADIALGADNDLRRTAAIAERLRRRAERDERVNDRARADARVAGDVHMRHETAVIADRHMRTDGAEGADGDAVADLRPGLDPCRGIDHCSTHASEIIAPTSASATICPRTLASPRYHHIILRRAMRVMWYSIVSPGSTTLRNFALSMVMKNTFCAWPNDVAAMQRTPAVCA